MESNGPVGDSEITTIGAVGEWIFFRLHDQGRPDTVGNNAPMAVWSQCQV